MPSTILVFDIVPFFSRGNYDIYIYINISWKRGVFWHENKAGTKFEKVKEKLFSNVFEQRIICSFGNMVLKTCWVLKFWNVMITVLDFNNYSNSNYPNDPYFYLYTLFTFTFNQLSRMGCSTIE